MIDKGLYRKNFSVGGRDGPASGDTGGKSGNSGPEKTQLDNDYEQFISSRSNEISAPIQRLS